MSDIVKDPQTKGDDPAKNVPSESVPLESAPSGSVPSGRIFDEGALKASATSGASTGSTGDTGATGSGAEVPKWIYQLSGDLQKDERLSSFSKPDELAKAYLEYAGKADRLVELPGEDDQDGWNSLYGKLGRPENPDGYDFEGVNTEGLDGIEDADLKEFRDLAYKLGLSQSQAKQLLEYSVNELKSAVSTLDADEKAKREQAEKQAAEKQAAMKAEKMKKIEALKKEYGDDFELIVQKAHRAFEAVGGKELGEYLDSTGLGDDPVLVRAFLEIADKIGEDTLLSGARVEGTSGSWYPNTKF